MYCFMETITINGFSLHSDWKIGIQYVHAVYDFLLQPCVSLEPTLSRDLSLVRIAQLSTAVDPR